MRQTTNQLVTRALVALGLALPTSPSTRNANDRPEDVEGDSSEWSSELLRWWSTPEYRSSWMLRADDLSCMP